MQVTTVTMQWAIHIVIVFLPREVVTAILMFLFLFPFFFLSFLFLRIEGRGGRSERAAG